MVHGGGFQFHAHEVLRPGEHGAAGAAAKVQQNILVFRRLEHVVFSGPGIGHRRLPGLFARLVLPAQRYRVQPWLVQGNFPGELVFSRLLQDGGMAGSLGGKDLGAHLVHLAQAALQAEQEMCIRDSVKGFCAVATTEDIAKQDYICLLYTSRCV